MAEEQEIDLEALQNNIDESQINEEVDSDQEKPDEPQEEVEEFDLDQALDSYDQVELDGRITNDEAIAKAKERGWNENGKDKYGHSVSAIEFLERTPLFHKMDLMRGDINEQKKQINKLLDQNKLIAKKSVEDNQKLVNDLKEAKEQLLNTELLDKDDVDKLREIDKKIEHHSAEPEMNQDEIVEKYEIAKDEFVKDNDWYQSNYQMTMKADKVGVKYATDYLEKNGVMPEPEETFKHVLKEIKKDFPDIGRQQRQTRVATRQNRTVAKHTNKKTLKDLPEDQQAIAKMVMESADLSEAEYLKTYEW